MGAWIRVKDMPEEFCIGRSTAYMLIREFKAQTDPKNFIQDGRITIIKKNQFEEWWRNRRSRR